MFLSVILTTRGRGPQALRCIERLLETTVGHQVEVVLVAYPDQSNLETFLTADLSPNIRLEWMEDRSIPCYNYGASLASGDYLMALDDDSWFEPGWLDIVESVFESIGGHGYVKIEGEGRFDHAERAIGNRQFYKDVLGGVLCIGAYQSQFDDVEKTDRARNAGLFFVSSAKIEHRHWAYGKAPVDDTYRNGGITNCERDRITYNNRKAEGFPNNYEAVIK